MKHTIAIRPAAASDAKAIYNFICALEAYHFNYDEFVKLYNINISDTDWIYLVAIDQKKNEVIGYVSCHGQLLLHHLGKVFEIQEMYVNEDYRGTGIGKLLISALEVELQSRECISLEVTTNKNRDEAIQFYSGCGFRQTHLKFTKEKKELPL